MGFSGATKQRLKTKYGSWALVTGASSGIGRELAIRLAESGLNVALVARRKSVLDELAADLHSQHGVQTRVVVAELSDREGNEHVIQETQDLDIGLLVASAGFGTSGRFIEADLEEEHNMLAVNCASLLTLTHHFSRVFAHRGCGGIILLSSMVGFQGVPYAAHYAATKAYVQSLAEALHRELRPEGVDVLAAAPGPVKSGFGQRANMKMDMALKPSDVGIPILNALGRKSTVLPGFLTKFLVTSLRTVPRWGKIRIMQKVMGGMTEHQRA